MSGVLQRAPRSIKRGLQAAYTTMSHLTKPLGHCPVLAMVADLTRRGKPAAPSASRHLQPVGNAHAPES